MNAKQFNRLHALRMANDAAGFAMEEIRPRFDRLAGRHENGTAPRAVVAYQLFQTPAEQAKQLAALLCPGPGARLLEPSAGLGVLIDAVLPFQPAEVVAVEMATSCAAELFRAGRPGVTIKQRDFLTLTAADLGLFDGVIMNPPFHMRSDIRHIKHALTFLKPGGRLVAICLNEGRRRRELGSIADRWIDIPAGAFGKMGTQVPTAMIVKQLNP